MKKKSIIVGMIITFVLIAIVVISTRIGLNTHSVPHVSDSDLSNMMIEHMNKKYDKEFKASGDVDTGFADSRTKDITLRCYVKGTDELKDYCTVRLNYEDKTYTDNYLCFQVNNEYEEYIKNLVSEYANNYTVFAKVENDTYSNGFPDKYDKNCKLKDIIYCEEFFNSTQIIIGTSKKDESEYKKIVNNIYSELVSKKIKGKFNFSFIPMEKIKNLDKDNYKEVKRDNCYYFESKPIYEIDN